MNVLKVNRTGVCANSCVIEHQGLELGFAVVKGKVRVITRFYDGSRLNYGRLTLPAEIHTLMIRKAHAILLKKPKLGVNN